MSTCVGRREEERERRASVWGDSRNLEKYVVSFGTVVTGRDEPPNVDAGN